MPAVSVEVRHNLLGRLLRTVAPATQQRQREVALAIAETAREIVPVDTGELQASIRAEQIAPFVWQVIAGADHAGYVEYGTVKMPAQPYLTPAVESQRRAYIAGLKAVFTR